MNVISPWCGNEARRPAPPFLSAFLDGVLNWPSGGFLCSGSVLKLFLFVDFNRSLLRFEGSLSFFLKKKGIIIEYLTFLFRKGLNPSLTTPKIEIASLEYSINFTSFYRQFWSLEKKKRTPVSALCYLPMYCKKAMKNVRVFQKDSFPSLMRNHYSRGIKKLFLR